jgi:outer membrane protein OmpA-like peptidoglycan-associated protein
MRRYVLGVLSAAALAACSSSRPPAELVQARTLYATLQTQGADRRASGEMLRAQEAINRADVAVARGQNRDYVAGLSHIALRTTQTAEAAHARATAQASADSLRTARLNRLLTLSEGQRQQLLQQNQLSQQEIAALRERNLLVSQQAEAERQRADSLRREAEAANAQLNQAIAQLQSLVTEITNLKQTSRGLVISLSDILFDLNKATLKPGAEQNVRRIAAVLKQYPDHQISVEGHTDSLASEAYNQRLSEDRAAAVKAALIAGGVDPAKISSRGFGESQPVSDNGTAAGRQQNRRVEVVVLGAGTVADVRAGALDTTRARPDTARRDTTRANPPTGNPPR